MKPKITIFFGIFLLFVVTTYAFIENTYHLHANSECFEIGKIPKFQKFGKEAHMVSCININPLEK